MFDRLPSVAYKCVIPVEQEAAVPTAAYHAPLEESGGAAHKLPFPAYPEIRKSSQPLCFPTLRAVYFPLHSSILSLEEVQKATAQYLAQHPDISDPTLIEKIVAANNVHVRAWQELIETGKFPQEYSVSGFIDSYGTPLINSLKEMGYFAGGRASLVIWQSQIHGSLPVFYGASDAFALVHEHAHRIAMWLYSGVLLDERGEEIHYAISKLMSNSEVSSDEVSEYWEFFEQAHNHLTYLARKFEPIEEIFAVYVGMLFLPSTVRGTILDKIEKALIKRGWFKAYDTFAKACDTCQVNTSIGAALAISEMVCRFLVHIDTSATNVIEAVTKNFQTTWEIIRKETEGGVFTQEEKDAVEESLTKSLEQAGIPPEISDLVYNHDIDLTNLKRVSDAIEHSLARPEDKDIMPPVIMLIGRLSHHDVIPLIYPNPNEEEQNELHVKLFLDSIRQQLAHSFAIARQRLTLRCNLVCPFARKGKPCCRAKEELSRLYNRLPEGVRAQVIPLNCDLIR